MCCPLAKRCPTYEIFTCEANQHLAWAFCLGEYRDCDRYKCAARCATAGAVRSAESHGAPEDFDRQLIDGKERILARLRASLLDPPAKAL